LLIGDDNGDDPNSNAFGADTFDSEKYSEFGVSTKSDAVTSGPNAGE
jgi:hypothetical protein